MGYFVIKVALSAILIVLISELAKRSTFFGGLLASLPIISLLAIVWLYFDTRELDKIAALSWSIFYLVLPSLAFFLILPWAIHRQLDFWPSLGIAVLGTILAYLLTVALLKTVGVRL